MSKDTSRIKKLLGLSTTLPMGSAGGSGLFSGLGGHNHGHSHAHGAGCGCGHSHDHDDEDDHHHD